MIREVIFSPHLVGNIYIYIYIYRQQIIIYTGLVEYRGLFFFKSSSEDVQVFIFLGRVGKEKTLINNTKIIYKNYNKNRMQILELQTIN